MYMPVSIRVLAAAQSGAMAGIAMAGRGVGSAYSTPANLAGLFAEEVDRILNNASPNVLVESAVSQISQDYWAGRYPVGFVTLANYTAVATAVVAAVNACTAWFSANVTGEIPSNGSGGASYTERTARVAVTAAGDVLAPFPSTYDGVVLVQGDTIILAGQEAREENGPWSCGPVAGGFTTLTRPSWYTGELTTGATRIRVQAGKYAGEWNTMGPTSTFTARIDNGWWYPVTWSETKQMVAGSASFTGPILSMYSGVTVAVGGWGNDTTGDTFKHRAPADVFDLYEPFHGDWTDGLSGTGVPWCPGQGEDGGFEVIGMAPLPAERTADPAQNLAEVTVTVTNRQWGAQPVPVTPAP